MLIAFSDKKIVLFKLPSLSRTKYMRALKGTSIAVEEKWSF